MEEGASDDVSALSKRHLSGVAPPEDHETWLRAMTHDNYREIATYLGWREWSVDERRR